MKSILIIFFLFLCYNVVAQYPSQQNPTQFSTGWFKQGWPQADSGHILAVRPPNFTPRFPGTTILYQNNGVDTSIHYWTGGRWIKINPNGIDTTPLHNQILLKLNISDTASMLLPYLRKADTTDKWVQDIYARNDSLFKFKNDTETFIDTLNGGGASGLTSVGLSMPSAFSVSGSPLTSNGTINVSGAGTTDQYIRGNGTLATTDTGMIPNFHLKVRSLFSGTSPITFNSTSGEIGINNANTSGTKGAATFSSSSFSDNGSGAISLVDVTTAGGCINCDITFDAKGRAISFASGTPPQFVNAPGAGDTLSRSDTLKRLNPGYGIIHALTDNNITQRVDTGATGLATQYDLTQISQENISNASLIANDNYSQNWSDNQWYVDSIAGSFLFRMGGIGSTGTRRKEFRINWGGSSFGDNLDGFNMLASIKKADLSADSLTMGLQSSGTGVLSMGTYNIANSANNNFISYSATSGLININAKDSIWMKGAVPAATADSILGVVFRSASGTSKVVKIPITAAATPTPSWQNTLDVSNTHTSTLIYDTTMVGNPVEKLWHRYEKLVKTDTATSAFYDWQFSGSNNGSFNEVRMFGWNLNAGGGQVETGKPAIGEAWESNYQINPAYPVASDRLMEKHEVYVTPAGTQHRLSSYTINTNTGTIGFYHTVGNFSLYGVSTHTPYFSVQGVGNATEQTYINPSDQTEYFHVGANFEQDINTANYTLSSASGKPINLYNISGFTTASFPDVNLTGQGYDGAEIRFNGATDGLLGRLLSDSAQMMLSTFTDVPIRFMPNTAAALDLRSTRINISLPTAIGIGFSTPIAQLDVRKSSGFVGYMGGASGNILAIGDVGGNDYGYLSYSSGANSVGITSHPTVDIAFSNAAERMRIKINGAIGINTTGPAWGLDVQRSMGANKDSITIVSSFGSNSILLQDTTNGKFQRISATAFATGNTLYTGNGTLGSDRNVSSGGFTLRVDGANNSDTLVSITNTGTSSVGLYSLGSLYGVDAQSTNVGLRAFGTGTGLTSTGDNNEGGVLRSNAIRGATIQSVPATTNTVQEVLRIERGVNGSPGANGIGGSINFYNKRTDNSSVEGNTIASKFTDAVAATLTSQLYITGSNNGSTATIFTLDGNGTVTTTGKRIIATTTSSAGTLTIGNAEAYIFNGTTTTWTLPAVSGTSGTIYYLKNIGSGSITLNADSGNNEIYTSSAVNTTTITAGSAIILISNGTYFTVQ